jgi:hypothetical protein
MRPVFRSHTVAVPMDDETWTALADKAVQRGETPADLIAYAIEAFMEREGFTPDWARLPLDLTLAQDD